MIDRKSVHVFLSAEGECNGLYVSGYRTSGFIVREQGRGTSSVTFSYRVVGRRRDIRGERMKKVTVPPTPPAPEAEPETPTVKPRRPRSAAFYRATARAR